MKKNIDVTIVRNWHDALMALHAWYFGSFAKYIEDQQKQLKRHFDGKTLSYFDAYDACNVLINNKSNVRHSLFQTLVQNDVVCVDEFLPPLESLIVVEKRGMEYQDTLVHEILFSMLMRQREGDDFRQYVSPIVAAKLVLDKEQPKYTQPDHMYYTAYCAYEDAGPTIANLKANVYGLAETNQRDTKDIEAYLVRNKDDFMERMRAPFEFMKRQYVSIPDFHHENICVKLENGVPIFRLIDFERMVAFSRPGEDVCPAPYVPKRRRIQNDKMKETIEKMIRTNVEDEMNMYYNQLRKEMERVYERLVVN